MKQFPWQTSNIFRKVLPIFLMTVFITTESYSQETSPVKSFHGVPVTKQVFNDDTAKLQFAIIADLWGGMRPGIFEDAVNKLELLQPQFVMSVGDLIDGKSYEPKEINEQWDEFDVQIKPLSMPFFYVPGNHDIGNAIMEEQWKKRLGSPYYHFVYKNTLFLSINTEDGGRGGITNEQVAYFQKAIEANVDVRWTFIFMHRPVWQGKNGRQEGYEKIEAFLKGRNYTLFSGHHHTYLNVLKNGNKHFVLGSTGGGSDLRGEKFGEFDHITMVTLNEGEPKIVNLKLDGIIKENIVDEEIHSITQTLINEEWLRPVPFVSDHQMEKRITAEIILQNPTDYPLKITGQLSNQKQLSFSPNSIDTTLAPKSEVVQKIVISKADKSMIDLAEMPFVDISLNGEYVYNNIRYMLPATKKMLLSWKLIPALIKKKDQAKSNLFYGQDSSGMIALTQPEHLDRKWYWSGETDGLLKFKLVRDEKFVYLEAVITDDQWVKGHPTQKDLLYVYLEDSKGGQNLLTSSLDNTKMAIEGKGAIGLRDIVANKHFDDSIFTIQIKIPIQKLIKKDNTIRLNIGYRDQDNLPEKQFSVLFWKPVWGSAGDYKNSGTFILQ